jgi:hypothetical protein
MIMYTMAQLQDIGRFVSWNGAIYCEVECGWEQHGNNADR